MRVTLVKPPEQARLNFGTFSLAVLASAVTDIADVNILDATYLSMQDSVAAILNQKPDVVGITTMSLQSVDKVALLVQSIRQKGFMGKIVAGGHGASMLPLPVLQSGADVVVYGEGEETFRELLQNGFSEQIQGIYFLKDGTLQKTPPRNLVDIEKLKAPARNLCPKVDDDIFLLETSRGCPHSCSFCETSRFFFCTWRGKSPHKVVEEIKGIVNDGAVAIQIADDNFTANPKRVIEICRLLKDQPLPLFFMFSARTDDLLKEPALIGALAEGNFLRATIGVETLVPQIAKSIGKPIDFSQHKQAFNKLRKAGIFSVASFIVGLPAETEAMRAQYVEWAVELADSAVFLPFQPFPGTPMEAKVSEPEDWCVRCAEELTLAFRRHPVALERLGLAAQESTVRGMLARVTLKNWASGGA
ncbi:MAG: B12-binding domain-containing radical SAM protein [Candidatus Bathyarchaeota archaeon]|nr:B12-binding domain-containing radical SAM protein [Candidatus Bathyarchaeota archaeon]